MYFQLRRTDTECGLISYVDDGTVIVQSKSLNDNVQVLSKSYAILFRLFTALGLVLEHDKSEVFHFDRSHSQDNPPVDLGFAPYTGDTPLKPKTYWRYLGFFFDHKLLFNEHVRFYSTKAFTTVQAMRMLGNSTRGLDPIHKRILYHACVLPIATYGFRMWYYKGARNKGLLSQLSRMQRKAAVWITGAFRTSPSGGVEAIAGLPPIHIHLEKLGGRANYRLATLSDTHPLRALLSREHAKGFQDAPHKRSIARMSAVQEARVHGAVVEANNCLPFLTEPLEPCVTDAQPG